MLVPYVNEKTQSLGITITQASIESIALPKEVEKLMIDLIDPLISISEISLIFTPYLTNIFPKEKSNVYYTTNLPFI